VNLAELAALDLPRRGPSVPDWTLGCFRRRSITFFDGRTDDATRVYWLQSRGLTADLRLSPGRPDRALADCTAAERAALAEVEGGLAATRWDGELMSWSGWTAFQTRDKWPEPGILRRVGDCLIEHAPSGAYVEDWRLQPSAPGPLVGLRLVEERLGDQVVHRGGGLIVCGDHAALVLGRPHLGAEALFAFEASYAVRRGGELVVVASTLPEREGQPLLPEDGFTLDGDRVVQRIGPRQRLFTVDTLEARHTFRPETSATAEARAWLARESGTLLAHARSGEPIR
jgi:hypothetical protein